MDFVFDTWTLQFVILFITYSVLNGCVCNSDVLICSTCNLEFLLTGIGGYEGRQPSKFMFSRNKKSRKHEMELVGDWSAEDDFNFEHILSNYPAITNFIKDELKGKHDREYNIYIYYDYNYIIPVAFTDSDKWNLEEEMWSLDSAIIRKKEIQEFLKYFNTSTRSNKKGRLGKMTMKRGFKLDPLLSSFPNVTNFIEHEIKGPKKHDYYIYLDFDFRYGNEHCSNETSKLEKELTSLREQFLYSVSTSNHYYMSGAVLVSLARLLIRFLCVCTSTEIAVLLMFVGPVTTDMLPDSVFEWKNTTNPVISTLRQRIALEWLYASKEPVTSMVFTRFRNSSDIKVPVGRWTKEGGFITDPFISTEMTLITDNINGSNEKKVSLILENPIHIDYDLQYNCRVNCGEQVARTNFSIQLKALRPDWTHTEDEQNATLGNDVTFLWEYKYPYKAIVVYIRQENNSNNKMVEVGYLYQGGVTGMGQFINRVTITKTANEDETGEKIRLTLKNVSVEDFGWKYACQVVLGDGEQLLTRTVLKEVDVKPSTVAPRTDSRTSTAARSPTYYSTIILLVIVTSTISLSSQD